MRNLENNVMNFINECSKEIGKFADDEWNIGLWSECQELKLESPIEQLLYCALKTIRKLNYIEEDEIFEDGKITYQKGLGFYPQYQIEQYRVDFLIGNYTYLFKTKTQYKKEIIVECDSQRFHDRTEPERRYEKQRDRFLQTKGYKTFHYTGTEILKNPLIIAQEIIVYIMESDKQYILISSNID